MRTSVHLKLQPPKTARVLTGPAILVVEDNPQNAELLEAFLADLDARVFVACDGVDALQKVEQYRPDLIVLDLMMPRMSGFEVCRRLKADPVTRAIPILMLTALSESKDVERAREVGADDFISKPISKLDFLTRVKDLLESTDQDRTAQYDGG
jgi:two-component system alkaline phosphatase synthesis response regulator PhoP